MEVPCSSRSGERGDLSQLTAVSCSCGAVGASLEARSIELTVAAQEGDRIHKEVPTGQGHSSKLGKGILGQEKGCHPSLCMNDKKPLLGPYE